MLLLIVVFDQYFNIVSDPKEKEKLLDILDSTIDIFLGKNNNG